MTGSVPRPRWLRPAACAAALAIHLGAFAAYRPHPGIATIGPVAIDILNDPAPETRPTPESVPIPGSIAAAPETVSEPDRPPVPSAADPNVAPPPVRTPEAEPPPDPRPTPEPVPVPEPEPTPVPEPTLEPVPTPDLVPAPASPVEPETAPADEPPPPRRAPPVDRDPTVIERPPIRAVAAEPRPPRRETRERRATPSVDSRRSEASRPRASAPDPTAVASYAAEVAAALRRLRHYPAAARDSGITGTVTVTFIIGPGGRVATQAIVHSSGHPVLDQAARAILGNLALRPPPSGMFRATVPIRFELGQ